MSPLLPWPIENISGWLPGWQAAGFFGATFVLEDVATIGAGLLLAGGAVKWSVAFVACFLGIWLGDAGLYALARFGGRNWFERSTFKRFAPKVAASEKWFTQRGTTILIFSRMIPGARLPTYLAAGFLRIPLPGFLAVTGLAAFFWTLFILVTVQLFGQKVLNALGPYKMAGWILLLVLGSGMMFGRRLSELLRKVWQHRWPTAIERMKQWEFWPAWLFYLPVGIHYVWLALKYRGFNLPTAANPGIFSGGLVGESKMQILNELFATNADFTAEAALLDEAPPEMRLARMREVATKFGFPLVLKPELGQRGAGVRVIRNLAQAEDYLKRVEAPVIAQRYVAGPFEIGLFYYRFPNEKRGHIFAITEKIFPTIVGDGASTISELIEQDARARLVAGKYHARFRSRLNEVLSVGQTLKLVEAGNHAQGCIFADGMRFATPQLLESIDQISQNLPGFFIGRYDIRFADENALRDGKDFKIIELNGAASEATSIYDSRNSLFSAYRTLFQQWDLVFAIGAANRLRGHSPMSLIHMLKAWRDYGQLAATYPISD